MQTSPVAEVPSQVQRALVVRLVREFHADVYRCAYRLCGNASDAEDLTQQTFLIAQQKIHQVRDEDRSRGWLLAVLRSCYLRSLRRKKPIPAANLELDVSAVPAATERDDIDRDALQLALNSLSDDYKLVLVMFYFEDRSYKEIAETLGLPIGTVMSRLSRAKGRLRHILLERTEQIPAAVDATQP